MQLIRKLTAKFLQLLIDLEKYRLHAFLVIYFSGVFVYYFLFDVYWLSAFYHAAALFVVDAKINLQSDYYLKSALLYIVGFFAAVYTILFFLSLLARRLRNNLNIKIRCNEPYILVCGLGEKAQAYIDSELAVKVKNILVVEKDKDNLAIEEYRDKGVAVKLADASDIEVLKKLKIDKTKHIVALANEDDTNLEIAIALKETLKDKETDKDKEVDKKKNGYKKTDKKQLYIHLRNRELDKFYKDGGLLDDSSKLELNIFSMIRNSAKALFLKHDIDGETREYIDSDKPFGIVVVGYSELAVEVIKQACELAHFPNENKMTIYCVAKDAAVFQKSHTYHYGNAEQILNIEWQFLSLDYQTKDFYQAEFWQNNNITNIMLCNDDEEINLSIAVELADSTYLEKIEKKKMQTKIHIALYDKKNIAQHIIKNQDHFQYFYAFARTYRMASNDLILNKRFEIVARCIHSGYAEKYSPDNLYDYEKRIAEKWNDRAKLSDRNSSRAQAYHIPIKLKALGLEIDFDNPRDIKKAPNQTELETNRKFLLQGDFIEELKKLGLDDNSLKEKTKNYDNFDIFEKEYDYFPKNFSC